mmetsp:Transcript_21954/g.38874  ORF Transcript_21954/g.38874 Transcript_21954/m.38874 type:complete len:201 (+) Transcript_21954:459-1061(+)
MVSEESLAVFFLLGISLPSCLFCSDGPLGPCHCRRREALLQGHDKRLLPEAVEVFLVVRAEADGSNPLLLRLPLLLGIGIEVEVVHIPTITGERAQRARNLAQRLLGGERISAGCNFRLFPPALLFSLQRLPTCVHDAPALHIATHPTCSEGIASQLLGLALSCRGVLPHARRQPLAVALQLVRLHGWEVRQNVISLLRI